MAMTSIEPYRECARDEVAASETPRSSYGRVPCRSMWRGLGSHLRRSETAVAFVAMQSIIVAHAWKDVSLTSLIFNHKEASLYISNPFCLLVISSVIMTHPFVSQLRVLQRRVAVVLVSSCKAAADVS